MRQICSRKNYNLYINDAFNLARNGVWDTFTYIHMIPIMRFLHHFYTDIFLLKFIYHHKYMYIYKHIPP